jgi:hypothetical protein
VREEAQQDEFEATVPFTLRQVQLLVAVSATDISQQLTGPKNERQ